MTREFFFPLIDTFLQALPHAYRNVKAEVGMLISVCIDSEIGGDWFLIKDDAGWILNKTSSTKPTTEITIDPDTAWKLFTKGMHSDEAEKKIKFTGDIGLGKPLLSMLSVMA